MLFFLTPTASHADFFKQFPMVFQVGFSDDNIAKNLAAYIPITIMGNKPTTLDLIFIDDNEEMINSWTFQAMMKGKKLTAFNDPDKFFAVAESYNKCTPIYIDSDLQKAKRGEEYAQELYAMGFKDIYLATGYDKRQFQNMYWIKSIVNKTPPF